MNYSNEMIPHMGFQTSQTALTNMSGIYAAKLNKYIGTYIFTEMEINI